MGCITELLESGAKRVHERGSYVEGGGIYKDYEYLIVLNEMGHRCGYVAISESHPLHKEQHYDAINIDMHGGCTFYDTQMTASDCNDKWIGFDCGHFYDASDIKALKKYDIHQAESLEKLEGRYASTNRIIRKKAYVEKVCKKIIDQVIINQPIGE